MHSLPQRRRRRQADIAKAREQRPHAPWSGDRFFVAPTLAGGTYRVAGETPREHREQWPPVARNCGPTYRGAQCAARALSTWRLRRSSRPWPCDFLAQHDWHACLSAPPHHTIRPCHPALREETHRIASETRSSHGSSTCTRWHVECRNLTLARVPNIPTDLPGQSASPTEAQGPGNGALPPPCPQRSVVRRLRGRVHARRSALLLTADHQRFRQSLPADLRSALQHPGHLRLYRLRTHLSRVRPAAGHPDRQWRPLRQPQRTLRPEPPRRVVAAPRHPHRAHQTRPP